MYVLYMYVCVCCVKYRFCRFPPISLSQLTIDYLIYYHLLHYFKILISKIPSNIYIFHIWVFFRNITPTGLPEEFSLVYTLRARKSPKYAWHIMKIVDARGDAQFLITMNPKKQTLDFSLINDEGKLQTVSFLNDRVSALGS